MKQQIFSLLALAASATAFAGPISLENPVCEEPARLSHTLVPMEAAAPDASIVSDGIDKYDFTLAGKVSGFARFSDIPVGSEISQAFCIPSGLVRANAGNYISGMLIYSPTDKSTGNDQVNLMTKATVWLKKGNLGNEPFFKKDVTLSEVARSLNTITFDPQLIEGDEAIYVGWTTTIIGDDSRYVAYDNDKQTVENGGFFFCEGSSVSTDDSPAKWFSYSESAGNICMSVTLQGESLAQNGVSVLGADYPDCIAAGQTGDVFIDFRNYLAATVRNVEVEMTYPDGTKTTATSNAMGVANGAAQGMSAYASVKVSCPAGLAVPVKYVITKVNGEPNTLLSVPQFVTSGEFEVNSIDPNNKFARKLVVEQGTGTWCGYCPRGIVMMETLAELDPDGNIIRIAVHSDGNGQRDPLTSATYSKMSKQYFPSLPYAYVNRCTPLQPDGKTAADAVVKEYDRLALIGAPFGIDLEAEKVSAGLHVKMEMTSAFDIDNSDSRYQMAVAVTEDNVGPYSQTNYFSWESYGGQGGYLAGWSELPGKVSMIYNEVARTLEGFPGIQESATGEIKAGEPVTYSMTISERYKGASVNVIAFVIDSKSGYILNATQKKVELGSGIEAIEAEVGTDAPVEYFNLQGVRVANPAKGQIYIVRKGQTVTKQLF